MNLVEIKPVTNDEFLSECINCVPKIEGNEEKPNGMGTCICKECSL